MKAIMQIYKKLKEILLKKWLRIYRRTKNRKYYKNIKNKITFDKKRQTN